MHNDFRAWRFLRVSHYEVVIGMPPEKQRELLDRADRERWSAARLSEEAGKKPRKAKAPSTPVSPQSALIRIRRIADDLAPLAAQATAVDSFLVPVGVDAKAAAAFTETMGLAARQLEGLRKEVEQIQARSKTKTRLKSISRKIAAPG